MSRRNGTPLSDRTTMRLRFLRHGDLLTLTARIEDPVNFDGPYYMTRVFQLIGAPLGRRNESDPVDLARVPTHAHIRVASQAANDIRLLRRGYNFTDGVDPERP